MKNNLKMSFLLGKETSERKAQVTIFIIIAIMLVAAVVVIFLLRDKIFQKGMPKEVLPVYNYFLSCIEDNTKQAALVMESQAGYLELPEFEAGSEYMPFSSQLNFLGFAVPYWYYVSANGIIKEQIPSKEKMEQQIEEHLKDRIKRCNFRDFESRGFIVERENPEVDVSIKDERIEVKVDMPLTISSGDLTSIQKKHEVSVKTRLGKFYSIAKKIYEKEKEDMFLENYGIDILRLYAPVDGTELTCSPKVWSQDSIKTDLKNALQENTQAIKVKGNYYALSKKENKYFVQDIGENVGSGGEAANFLYFNDWPTKIEIYPDEDPLIANPVGLQEGLGILGFCYVPYHFVYDMDYPVLMQIYGSGEMFQFPVAVVIDKNKPREAIDAQGLPDVVKELCQHKLTEMNVHTYDTELNPIEAQIKYKCFDTNCFIGNTTISGEEAGLTANFPQCVNGFIIANAEGYATKKYIASTVASDTLDIILDKKYKLALEIKKSGKSLGSDYAIVTLVKGDSSTIAVYPEQKEIELTEGQYSIKVYVYSNSTINLQGSTTEKCVDVPKSGIFGVFGATEEKCFTLQIPDQVASSAVSGGGKQEQYFSESELKQGKKLIINAQDFGTPTKVEELQANYNNIEINSLEVSIE